MKKKLNKKNSKSISSSSVLVQLYQNKKLVSKVDVMLDEGQSYEYIVAFCEENGLSISKASLTNYKKKREEAIETGKPLLLLLDKRAKDNVTYIKSKEKDVLQSGELTGETATVTDLTKVDKVFNDLELLDEVISKGMKGLKQFEVVDTPLAMKAIELKAKITNNTLSGLSVAGLREIHMRMQAKESAMTEIIMKYVAEDLHEQLFQDLEDAEKEFYENLDLTEEDRRISKAIQNSGLGM